MRVMVGARLDQDAVLKLDEAAQGLGVSRSAFISDVLMTALGTESNLTVRSLAEQVEALSKGIPLVAPSFPTDGDQSAIAPGQLQSLVDRLDGLEQLLENYEGWVRRQIAPVADRVAAIEAVLKKRGVL
jgi:hypothetical protein